jgi:hypothetical protein
MKELLLSHVILLALAVYSIGRYLSDAEMSGPWHILDKFRHLIGVRFNEASLPYGENIFAEAMLCQYCNSFWIGLIVAVLYLVFGDIMLWLLLPFSITGVVTVLVDWRWRK